MSYRFVALVLVSFSFAACKPKSEPAAANEPGASAPAKSSSLSAEQEEAITKDFITRFLDAVDADDVTRWPEMITKERAEQFQQEGKMEIVYSAWRRSTATISERLRKAPFRLDPGDPIRILHFEGVNIANDPDTGYLMSVRIVDGKMYIDEN